ncbi:MAG: hypothetical protein K0R18_1664 [Bacillales bacterium]|jgi:hypothetical protein|nr:hypothetical protein [Bacillales bacterium]
MKQIDRIKSMTTNEMAEYLDSLSDCRRCIYCFAKTFCLENIGEHKYCKQTIKEYLESEVPTCESNKTQTE